MSNSTVVVITGVSSGIGRPAAEQLAKRGCRVFGTVRAIAKAGPLAGVEFVEPWVEGASGSRVGSTSENSRCNASTSEVASAFPGRPDNTLSVNIERALEFFNTSSNSGTG